MRSLVLALLVVARVGVARGQPATPDAAPRPATAAANADDAAQQAFDDAVRRMGEGDLAGARSVLEALAARAPDGHWADDALAEAAGIAERQGDLAGARGLWARPHDEFDRIPAILDEFAATIEDLGANPLRGF